MSVGAARASCVFCGIVRGAVASHVVHEDEQTLAFLDINPAADGHTRWSRRPTPPGTPRPATPEALAAVAGRLAGPPAGART